MEKKYYKYGLRPIREEIEKGKSTFYAFQWDTGVFKQDMTYYSKIRFDISGDREDLTEKAFNDYVKKIKKEKGL
ncbi:MAG: hypothetical protein WCP57_08715 [Bacteroidota bacterium]